MLAFGLCIGLFLYFLVVGSAAVRSLHATRNVTQDLLLSPILGVGITLIPIFLINRMGIPVRQFGMILAIVLLALAVGVHTWRFRRTVVASNIRSSLIDYAPFFGVILLGAYLTGRPMLTFGFDWLSFCNNDMANYCLAADRFFYSGFLDLPSVEALSRGTDYSQSYWFMHVPSMVRAGSELILAWTSSLTGVSTIGVFMPVIVTFHLTLISAAMAMVMSTPQRRGATLVAGILIATCAQLTFGAVYQLIAQSAGLAILAANTTLLLRPFENLSRAALVRHGTLVAVGLTAQLLIYPEVNPLLGIGFFVYIACSALRRQLAVKPLLIVLGIATLFALLLLNTYTYDALAFMLKQRKQATSADDPAHTLFPFFLLPSGFANYWGFVRIASNPMEPYFSIAILLGATFLLASCIASVRESWAGEPAAAVALVCLLLGGLLFLNTSGFSLYKLAMFAQPFVLGTLAIAWARTFRRWKWAVWVLLLLGVPGLRSQAAYVNYSQDGEGATFNEIIGATSTHMLREFAAKVPDAHSATAPPLLCDSYNISLTKLLAASTRGRQAAFPSSRLTLQSLIPDAPPDLARQSYIDDANRLSKDALAHVHESYFEFDPYHPGTVASKFFFYGQGGRPDNAPDSSQAVLIASTKEIGLFNRRAFGNKPGNFFVVPLSQVHNHLLFTETTLSQPYYMSGEATFISVYQLERDPQYFVGETMGALGRYLVFEVLRPDEEVRIALDITCSLQHDGENALPPAVAIGATRTPFQFVGRGAGRVFSPPIKPQMIRGRYYVGLDLGRFGTQFKVPRTGVMNWFGTSVALDRRQLVAFGRDISLISEKEFAGLKPPGGVHIWRSRESELANPDLQFSGLYEDGWISEHAYLDLTAPGPRCRLILKGSVNGVDDANFKNELTVKIDGKPVQFTGVQNEKPLAPGPLGIGAFDLVAEVPPASHSTRRVELEWSNTRRLPGEDGRPVAALMTQITLEPITK